MHQAGQPEILSHLATLADGLRSRILLVLESHELTVSELCSVLQLPQSTVSRHLKTLADGGWVVSRPDGTRRLYRVSLDDIGSAAAGLWELTRPEVGDTAGAEQDALRLASVLAQQRDRSREFFNTAAGHWDDLRDELFGRCFYAPVLLGLLDDDWTVADLGTGTGRVAETIAPFVRHVIAIDGSEAMLDAARRRAEGLDNLEVRQGELEALPIGDQEVDAATLMLVLHHLPDPARAVSEVERILRPGGRVLMVDMLPHDRQEYRLEMGHAWLGFSERQIRRYLREAGFSRVRFQALEPDPKALGPNLFAVSATVPAARAGA